MESPSIGKAIAALVLGIISVSFSAISAIFFFFYYSIATVIGIASIVCGILAIIFGNQARPSLRASSGLVLGIIGTSLTGSIIAVAYILQFFI